jgi:ribosomal-protein-serine acetyltransferase
MGARTEGGAIAARITTERLRLERLGPGDAAQLEEVVERARASLEPWIEVPPPGRLAVDGGRPSWGIRLEDGRLIGAVQLAPAGDGVRVGYWLAPEHTGRGYASEAAAALIDAAFAAGARVAEICMARDNRASARVAARLGFVEADCDGDGDGDGDGDLAIWRRTPEIGEGAGWARLRAHAEDRYALESMAVDGFTLAWSFDVDDETVIEQRVTVTRAGRWVEILAPFAGKDELAAHHLLERAAALPVGALIVVDGEYAVRHVERVEELSLDGFDEIVLEVARAAAQLFEAADVRAVRQVCDLFNGFI